MARIASRLNRLFKIITQLGLTQVGLFALYKLGLKTGYYKRTITAQTPLSTFHPLFSLPSQEELLSTLGDDGLQTLLTEADQIVAGKFRIFGGELADIKLDLNHRLAHWVDYETGKAKIPVIEYQKLNTALNLPLATCDLKLLWEPARFGWAFTLGRAYLASGNEQYAKTFWCYFKIFDEANPVNMGPHWMNGQEVALRLIAFVWTAHLFSEAKESTEQRKARLRESITHHASRITPTLLYARSQNNNHLTSESAALYTAALALPDHPKAKKWRKLGIKWLNWSFENQIDSKGEYIQHSVNYHRLVLQLALWIYSLTTKSTKGEKTKETLRASAYPSWLTEKAQQNVVNAARWLADLTDPVSGNAPNLGANDGAYIFPLANGDFRDFRPVVQAASHAFLKERLFSAAEWDEMGLWFHVTSAKRQVKTPLQLATCDLRLATCSLRPATLTWAHLRVAKGNLRLAHADQLHLDLWWQGQNIALDSGTYLYNAEPPWDNPLAASQYHNTITVNARDQMRRASRFMYLDWAHGRVLQKSDTRIVAEHNGYRKLGITHRRTVSFADNIWYVKDNLQPSTLKPFTYRLHWLLPDGKWKVESRAGRIEISIKMQKEITFHISLITSHPSTFSLARAGKLLYGNAEIQPTRGWYSPTYGVKIPALSLALEVTAANAVKFITEYQLPS